MNPAELLDALKNCADVYLIDKLLSNWPESLNDVELPNELLQILNDAATVNPPFLLDVPCGHIEEGRALFKEAMEEMWQHYLIDCSVKFSQTGNCEHHVCVKITWPTPTFTIDNNKNYVKFVLKFIQARFDADYNEYSGVGMNIQKLKDLNTNTEKLVCVGKHIGVTVKSKHCIDPGQESEDEFLKNIEVYSGDDDDAGCPIQ